MNILNQPAALSLSGNIEKFRIQSAESFSLSCQKGIPDYCLLCILPVRMVMLRLIYGIL